jgi:hypothetical protein
VTTRRETLRFQVPDETYSHFAQLVLAPAGNAFLTLYSERNLVYAWSRARGAERPLRVATAVRAHTAAFLPDGRIVVATARGLEHYARGDFAPCRSRTCRRSKASSSTCRRGRRRPATTRPA